MKSCKILNISAIIYKLFKHWLGVKVKIVLDGKKREGVIVSLSEKLDHNILNSESKFDGNCIIEGTYSTTVSKIQLDLKASQKVCTKCDRCLKVIKKEYDFVIKNIYSKKDDIYKIEDDNIDLILETQYELSQILPLQILCKSDCKGLCNKCGINLNDSKCKCDEIIDETNPFAILKNIK